MNEKEAFKAENMLPTSMVVVATWLPVTVVRCVTLKGK